MDLGCLDMGCIEKLKNQSSVDSNHSPLSSSKFGKTKTVRDSHSSITGINKLASQIRKPPRRKGSPINWFPRMKVDSYLKRKIKLLHEVDGMNSTLDETLHDSNPHYSRVLREKIAVKEAAHKAMEARKAALVEASWCRILRASRIESKEAEAVLSKAEKVAAEAFKAATAIGVIMYDMPDCSRKYYEIETSKGNGGESTTHAVKASFETAFEVDKQVAAAVKAAFVKLANYTSKDEIKEMLRKISQNPDSEDINFEASEFYSECESDAGSEIESGSISDEICAQDIDGVLLLGKPRQQKYQKQFSENLHMAKLVDIMLERLKGLQEDELASLATIVATCGLSAALAEAENSNQHSVGSTSGYAPVFNPSRRVSSFGAGRSRSTNTDGQRQNQVETELPSLDKFLVKRLTRLEREVQEAKISKSNEAREGCRERQEKADHEDMSSVGDSVTADLGSILVKHKSKLEKEIEEAKKNSVTADLGSILVKHKSKLEKEIEEAKKNSGETFTKGRMMSNNHCNSAEAVLDFGSMLTKKHVSKLQKEIEEAKRINSKLYELNGKKSESVQNQASGRTHQEGSEIPSLDKALVKHVSKFEREVQEAKSGRKKEPEGDKVTSTASVFSSVPCSVQNTLCSKVDHMGKENIDLNQTGNQEVDTKQMGIPQDYSVERSVPNEQSMIEAAEALTLRDKGKEWENSLDKVLVKPVHRLKKEKMKVLPVGSDDYGVQRHRKTDNVTDCESLDKVLIKHVSRLEKEKMEYGKKEEVFDVKRSREIKTELETSEGSLDQILIKPKSRIEREKMAAAASHQSVNEIKHSATRREAREKEMQQAWGGLSLGNSIRPHQSRLQRDKAAWLKAEDEERRRATEHA